MDVNNYLIIIINMNNSSSSKAMIKHVRKFRKLGSINSVSDKNKKQMINEKSRTSHQEVFWKNTCCAVSF